VLRGDCISFDFILSKWLKETASAKGIGMAWHWTKALQEYFDTLLKKYSWKKKYLIKS
jgi:hypothetical protein